MKKSILFFVSIGVSLISFAQTADEILAKYFENVGGLEKIKNVNSFYAKGQVKYDDMSMPIEIAQRKDGYQIMKCSFQGQQMVQWAFDGSTCWETNFETMKPQRLDAEETENAKRTANDFYSPFVDYKQKGYAIELLSTEKIEGVACFKLKLEKKTILVEGKEVPNIEYYYFDKESFIPIMSEEESLSGEDKGMIFQKVYSDYQEIDGVFFPFSIMERLKNDQGTTIQYESIVLNKVFEDSFFVFPEK